MRENGAPRPCRSENPGSMRSSPPNKGVWTPEIGLILCKKWVYDGFIMDLKASSQEIYL